MKPSQKIDLSAIMKKNDAKEETKTVEIKPTEISNVQKKETELPKIGITKRISKVKTEVTKKEVVEPEVTKVDKLKVVTKKPSISISSIKTSQKVKPEIKEVEVTVQKIKGNIECNPVKNEAGKTEIKCSRKVEDKTPKIQKEIIIEEKKKLGAIGVEKSEHIESKKNDQVKEEKKEEKSELFGNYSSDFQGKENRVLENIKKLKNLPKTRPVLLFSIIIVTAIGISSLFLVDPDNHSINSYKSSILDSYNGITKDTKIPWEIIFRKIDNFEFPVEQRTNKQGIIEYRFKDTLFTDEISLNNVLNTELSLRKEEAKIIRKEKAKKITREILIERYITSEQ